jgi:transposase
MSWTVAIGVDTHRDFHVAVALDSLGRTLGSIEVATSEEGSERLLAFACSLGEPAFVVEGTGSYGASLTRFLIARGWQVYECERPRRRSRGQAKSDLIDAEKAAARLLSGKRLGLPRGGSEEREALRLLVSERRSCLRAHTATVNQLQAARLTAPREIQALLPKRGRALLRASLALADDSVYAASLRRLAERISALARELTEIDQELVRLTRSLCPRLLEEKGVGPVCAAQLLVSCGDPRRLHSEASFAALAGVSPIKASSGLTRRYRLNRGGDRQLNWALHMTALSRIQFHAETRDYYGRLLERGKSNREAIRCVKRMLARRLYNVIVSEGALCGT